jgi:hypothetical protein
MSRSYNPSPPWLLHDMCGTVILLYTIFVGKLGRNRSLKRLDIEGDII